MESISIVRPSHGELPRAAAQRLASFLERVSGRRVPVVNDGERVEGAAIVIGAPERNRTAGRLGFRHDWAGMRPDGYVVRSLKKDGTTCLVAAGREETGDKYAVHHLIRHLRVDGNGVHLEGHDAVANPFIKTREIIMSDACPWDPYHLESEVPEEERAWTYDTILNTDACRLNRPASAPAGARMVGLRRVVEKYCIENWPPGKLVNYVDQMDSYGFNSVEFADNDESYLHSGGLVSRRQYREKLVAMMQRARALGHRISLSVLGGNVQVANGVRVIADWEDPLGDERVVFDDRVNVKASFCWHEEQGRKGIDAQLGYLAGYGQYVDHIFSHFVDPGGCNSNGCTIGTCMRLMNHHLEVFRQVNPNVTATFNLWPLTSDYAGFRTRDVYRRSSWNRTYTFWHFTQVADLLDPAIMLASRDYNPEVAELCRRWNRPYGLWRWYTSDQEITASLHVEAERLGREIGGMPPEASGLEYCSMPSCCHGLNAASIYIAARLLWEPKRDPFDALREFCDLVFGPRVGPAAREGYAAIARIRNRDVIGDPAFDDSYLGSGTPDPESDAEVSGAALASLEHASIDEAWVPRIPLVVERQEMLDDLKDHLRMVHQYALFRTELARLIRQDRITPEDYRRLPKVDRLSVSGGMIEWRKVVDFLRAGAGAAPGGDGT